jgi:hypothetical protein
MANLRSVVIDPPEAGLETASGPTQNTQTAPVLRNFLPHYPGKAKMRGPIIESMLLETEYFKTLPLFVTGVITYNNEVLLGFASPGADLKHIGFVPGWKAPYIKPSAARELQSTEENMIKVNLRENSVSQVTSASNQAPILRSEQLGEFSYFITAAAGSTRKVFDGYRYNSEILTYNGSRINSTANEKSPKGSQFLKVHLERLWAFCGTDPSYTKKVKCVAASYSAGGKEKTESREALLITEKPVYDSLEIGDKVTAGTGGETITGALIVALNGWSETGAPTPGFEVVLNKPTTNTTGLAEVKTYTGVEFEHLTGAKIEGNSLYYSEQEGPHGTTPWSHVSPISGLSTTNKIVVGSEGPEDYLVGGAVVNQNLLIFKRHSIWYLTGYSPETWTLRQLTGEYGCIDPWSICEASGGVFFASQNGLEFFDGSEFHSIDAKVSNSVRAKISQACSEVPTEAESPAEYPSRCQISYCGGGYLLVNLVTIGDILTFDLNTNLSGTWLYHMDSGNWTELTSDAFQGFETVVASGTCAGVPWVMDGKYLYRTDYLTRPDELPPENEAADLDPTNGSTVLIPAMFETNRIDLASNGMYTSQGHRFLQDYLAVAPGVDDTDEIGDVLRWKVSIFDDSGKLVSGDKAYELTGQGCWNETKFIEGRRFEADQFTEAVAGVKIKVEAASDGEHNGFIGEIYGSVIEAQTARQRRKI